MHNRDQWVIEQLHRDHSVTASGVHGRVRLATDYVTTDVELGYAQTAHGSQGRTVDRSLTLIEGPVDARGIYVPMTRGRDVNTMYVAVEPGQSARDVLAGVLSRDWIDRPALDVLRQHRPTVVEGSALLSPLKLRGLWKELDDLASQRYHLAQAVDRVERTLHTKTIELKETVKRLEGSHQRMDDAHRQLDEFDSAWSRFRDRDTIDALHNDIDRFRGWVSEYEPRAATLRAEITALTGECDRAVAHRDTTRPGLIERSREIRSALNADALLRFARVEPDPPAYLRGIRRDSRDATPWRTTVGAIEQYRAAYGIDSRDALGPRPGYRDVSRADQYRRLEHNLGTLTPTHARGHEIEIGIEL